MSNDEIIEKYTDFISLNQRLICWGFRIEILEKSYEGCYGDPVKRALLQALKALSQSGNKRLRERSFTIWIGDYGWGYWVGIPSKISSDVVELIGKFLKSINGYEILEFGSVSVMSLIPKFRYEKRKVIEYSDFDLAGSERLDDEDWYGTGLVIHYRNTEPAFIIGEEKYQE